MTTFEAPPLDDFIPTPDVAVDLDVVLTLGGGEPFEVDRLEIYDGKTFVTVHLGDRFVLRFREWDAEQIPAIDRLSAALAKARELASSQA